MKKRNSFIARRTNKLAWSLISVVLCVFFSLGVCFAEQIQAERPIKQPVFPKPATEEKTSTQTDWYAGTFYDFGNVHQGLNDGDWTESTTWVGRRFKESSLYTSYSQFKRFSEKDYAESIGGYTKFKDYFLHEEASFTGDANFLYRFQNIIETSHELYKNLFWKLGYEYRHYSLNDTHLITPGLIYYLGDNTLSADFGISHIESRGTAEFGTVKGDFVLTKGLRCTTGATFGQWVYDIYGLPPGKENGYLIFTMFHIEVFPGVNLGAGYSYGTEKPSFIKRSIDVSLSINF